MKYAKIVPFPGHDDEGLRKTQGTRVVLPDGSELPGVTKIVLVAETNDLWRAEIHCHVLPPDDIEAVPTFVQTEVPPADEHGAVEMTDLGDGNRRFAQAIKGIATGIYPEIAYQHSYVGGGIVDPDVSGPSKQ